MNPMRAVLTGALLLCLSTQAVRAGDEGTVSGPVAAPPAKAECIKAPDAPQVPTDIGRLPGQAFRSEPLDEEEMAEALGPLGVAAGGIVLLGGMLWLLMSGRSSRGLLDSSDDPDSTYGLRPGR